MRPACRGQLKSSKTSYTDRRLLHCALVESFFFNSSAHCIGHDVGACAYHRTLADSPRGWQDVAAGDDALPFIIAPPPTLGRRRWGSIAVR